MNDDFDMEALEKQFEANKDKVVNMLIDQALHVDVSIPRVVQGKFEMHLKDGHKNI